MNKIKNIVFISLGFLFLGLGVLGAIFPILPATPFLLLTACFFAKGSDKFHKWFISTNLYKKYIDSVVGKKEMPVQNKVKLLTMLGIIFAIGIYFSPGFAKIIILLVAVFHFYYFIFRIKTKKEDIEGSNLYEAE